MPTDRKSRRKNSPAARILRKHRSAIVKNWMSLFPKARWSRKEARQISGTSFDAVAGFIETGRSRPALEAIRPILDLAATKDAVLSSGLAQMASAKSSILGALLGSRELEREELQDAVLKVNELFDNLAASALGSRLRATSATEELLRRISFHKGILKNPNLAVFASDQKGKVVLWSEGVERITGIKQKLVHDKRLPAVLRDTEGLTTRDIPETEILEAFATLRKRLGLPPYKEPLHVLTTLSQVFDDAGVFLGTVGVALDVTKITAAQKRLEELAQIIENAADAIVRIAPDGRVVYWNKGAVSLTGYSVREALGRTGRHFVKWGPHEYSKMLRTLNKEGRWRAELTGVRKDGSEYAVIASATALYSSAGKYIGSLIVSADITELKTAQDRVAEQARLLDQTNEAVAQTDAEGKVVFWNKGAEVLTGYTKAEALGKGRDFLNRVAPEYDRERMLEAFRRGEVFTRELPLIKKNGKRVTALVSHTPLRSSKGAYLGAIAVAMDMSELKRTRETVREQADLLDRAKDAIIRTDSEGRMIFWNAGAENLTGYKKKEVLGKSWSFFRKVFPDIDRETMISTARKRNVLRADVSGFRKDGKTFTALVSMTPLVSPSGEYGGMLGIVTDVTRLRKAERRVSESQKLLQTVLDNIDDLVAVVDQDMNLVFSNRAIRKYTGFSEKDYRAARGPYYMMPHDDEKSIESVSALLRKARGPHVVELSIPTRKGEMRRAEWRAVRIDDKEPGKYKIVTVGRDMTERIRAEEESKLLLELNSALGRSLRLEEISPEALTKTMEVLKADAGLVAILTEDTARFDIIAHKGMTRGILAELEEHGAKEGWTGRVLRTGKPLVIEDIHKSKYSLMVYPETQSGGYVSFVSIPLRFEKRVFGVIEMGSRRAGQFKRSDLEFVTSVANLLSSALYNAKLHSELERRQQDLTDLSEKLATVEEDEKRRIAADLHDETGQLLAAARANLQMTAKSVSKSDSGAREMLEETSTLIGRALDQVRDVSHGLHPALLDEVGLPAAVKWLAQNTREAYDIKVRVRTRGKGLKLPSSVEASLFRAVQEILSNIGRHSNAEKVKIDIVQKKSSVIITVEDDGVGFDPAQESQKPRGLGLRTLMQRVRWLGGEFRLQSEPGKGTLVEIEIPTEEYENEGN